LHVTGSRKRSSADAEDSFVSAAANAGRAAIWSNIRKKGDQEFRAYEVEAGAETTRVSTGYYLRKLHEMGILDRRLPGRAKTGYLYKMRRDPGPVAPRVGRDESKAERGRKLALIWRTMRALKRFTTDELAAVASENAEQVEISVETCRQHLGALVRAGYVRAKRAPGGNHKIYELVRNTGPLPPTLSHAVFDRNLGQTVWTEAEGVIA
jgi:predicted transcriptional regulator